MNFKNSYVVLAMTCVAFAAQAAAPSAPASDRLKAACMAADFNHDGSVSLEEFHHDIVNGWHALPSDRDGLVILMDIGQVPGMNKIHLARLHQADTDKDGKLSFKEVVAARMAYFDAGDIDQNDVITLKECVDHERKLRPRNNGSRKSTQLKATP